MKELGEKVHLTGQATANRVTKLEELGVIKNYTINIDWFKAGKSIQTFLTIYTKSLAHKPFLSFIQQQQYIENIYKISGDGCYLIEGFFLLILNWMLF